MTKTSNLRVLAMAAAVVAAVLAAVAVAMVGTREAEAAFPGQNGRIAFVSDRVTPDNPTGDEEIYTSKPDGTGLKQLTFNTVGDYAPSYSPNGARIAYQGFDGNDFEIFTIPTSGGTPFNVTFNAADDYAPSYSPSGARIAYSGVDGNDYEIFTVPASGGAATNLTNVADKDYSPAYSPDGMKIAFGSNNEIYTMNTSDGSDQTNITNTNSSTTPAVESSPDWQPNTAPSITGVRPTAGSSLRDRTPRIKAVVRDTQNDLAGSDIKLYVDGRAKSFSYNRATDDLAYTTGRLSYGRHTVRIVARDEIGLTGTKSWGFRVVR